MSDITAVATVRAQVQQMIQWDIEAGVLDNPRTWAEIEAATMLDAEAYIELVTRPGLPELGPEDLQLVTDQVAEWLTNRGTNGSS